MSHSTVEREELQTVFQMWPHQLEQSQFPNPIVDKYMYAPRNAVDFILTDVKHSARDPTLSTTTPHSYLKFNSIWKQCQVCNTAQ